MKFPLRFSIAVLLTAVAMVAGFLAGYRAEFRVPEEYEGIWKVESATFKGINAPLSEFQSTNVGECDIFELIIFDDRIVSVDNSGYGSVVAIDKSTGSGSLKLEVKGVGYAEIGDPGPHFVILERHGPKLRFAWVDSNATRIDRSVSAGQMVYEAIRPATRKDKSVPTSQTVYNATRAPTRNE